MSLAKRAGFTDHRGYMPAIFVVTAFAVGMQLALIYQALGATPYPPPGKGVLAWSSLGVLAVAAVLHAPTTREEIDPLLARTRRGARRVRGWLSQLAGRGRALVLQRWERSQEGNANNGTSEPPEPPVAPAAPEAQRLKVRVHSPLSVGPVVAPGETLPLHVKAEPEALAQDLEITFTVETTGGKRQTTSHITGTDLVHTETFEDPGPFTVEVRVEHPDAQPAVKRLEGRVATYREEVGRLFDDLRERGMRAGLDVGPGSTPREVCRALPTLANASYEDAQALGTHLEVALYGDDDVDRSTYEAIHTILREVGALPREEATP